MYEDYYKTFYATEHGRRVLADIERMVYASPCTGETSAVSFVSQLALLNEIKAKAGFKRGDASVAAEAGIAAQFKKPVQEKPELLNP